MNAALQRVWNRWGQMDGTYYDNGPGRLEPPGVDCSGSVHWANSPEVPDLPASSSAVSLWARRLGIFIQPWQAQSGDLLLWGRDGNPDHGAGNDGHIGQLLVPGQSEWESTGPGVRVYAYGSRVRWNGAVDMSQWYGGSVGVDLRIIAAVLEALAKQREWEAVRAFAAAVRANQLREIAAFVKSYRSQAEEEEEGY